MELKISVPQGSERVAITGAGECNLKIIRELLGVRIAARNGHLRISGDAEAVRRAARIVEHLASAARRDLPMTRTEVAEAIVAAGRAPVDEMDHGPDAGGVVAARSDRLEVYLPDRQIRAKTPNQRRYLEAIFENDLTFCTGPAGSGKTYLAVAAAVAMLKCGQVRRLALVRPAVEAGEKLGFLPGDMQEKVNPYLRPLLDALHDMMNFDQIQRFMTNDVIEIIPLAFMRGRTLNDALIILDEAQNTTTSQMLMFLTRMGLGAKMIVTGDTTQIDLEVPGQSGLIDALRRLRRVNGVAMVCLEKDDIVRHTLVQKIVAAYGDGPSYRGGDGGPPAENP